MRVASLSGRPGPHWTGPQVPGQGWLSHHGLRFSGTQCLAGIWLWPGAAVGRLLPLDPPSTTGYCLSGAQPCRHSLPQCPDGILRISSICRSSRARPSAGPPWRQPTLAGPGRACLGPTIYKSRTAEERRRPRTGLECDQLPSPRLHSSSWCVSRSNQRDPASSRVSAPGGLLVATPGTAGSTRCPSAATQRME
jgi:hypothetical protein